MSSPEPQQVTGCVYFSSQRHASDSSLSSSEDTAPLLTQTVTFGGMVDLPPPQPIFILSHYVRQGGATSGRGYVIAPVCPPACLSACTSVDV